MSASLDRLNEIEDVSSLKDWFFNNSNTKCLLQIQEVVALAKSNQLPSIDAMRFEAARSFIHAQITYQGVNNAHYFSENKVKELVKVADALIAELQKPKP